MAEVELRGLRKSYGTMDVVHGIDLTVGQGEFVVLVGPSGCGKSTILRMIAGLEDITAGEIRIGGRRVNDLDARERNLAMVFQDYALYPHMTVAANMGFGLRMRGVAPEARARRVAEVADLLQLTPLLGRKPRALSGGQRQRVAMGRALARPAEVFLFDEPLSNLDAKLRGEVRTQIRLLHQSLGMTTVFVTHDQTEAMTLADRIVCLDGGRIAQVGSPAALYDKPETLFVAGFIGAPPINLLPVQIWGQSLRLADGQEVLLDAGSQGPARPRSAILGLRPEDLTDSPRFGPGQPLTITPVLTETLGSDSFVIGDLGGTRVTTRCAPGAAAQPGVPLVLQANMARAHLFDPETGGRL